MIGICVSAPMVMAFRLTIYNAEMQDLETVLSAIPAGKVIQPVITEPHSAAFHTFPFQHAAALYNYYKGGTSPYLFATWAAHFPIKSRNTFVPNAPGEWSMDEFRFEAHQFGTDYFLVRTRDPGILSDLYKHVPLASGAGEWQVFGPNPQRK
jgi:hypothetical protein